LRCGSGSGFLEDIDALLARQTYLSVPASPLSFLVDYHSLTVVGLRASGERGDERSDQEDDRRVVDQVYRIDEAPYACHGRGSRRAQEDLLKRDHGRYRGHDEKGDGEAEGRADVHE